MKKYAHLREKAIELRRDGATLTEICERLALGKSTVYYWIKDIPIPRTAKQTAHLRKATLAAQRKHAERRCQWYEEAYRKAVEVLRDPLMRDFVVLYAAEGYKRSRNHVSICNSDPSIVRIASEYVRRLSDNPNIRYELQCHHDNDEDELKQYWAELLGIEAQEIAVIRKSNAGNLSGRKWRSKYGVFAVKVGSTKLRCYIQAWMDYVKQEWSQSGYGVAE